MQQDLHIVLGELHRIAHELLVPEPEEVRSVLLVPEIGAKGVVGRVEYVWLTSF